MLINCDMGEGLQPNPDSDIMPWIDLANFACGGHAGDANTLKQGLALAKHLQVAVGAHPSYPDPEHFGRRSLPLSTAELEDSLARQLDLMQRQAQTFELTLHHVKPHGALYLDMMRSATLLESLLDFHSAWSASLGYPVAFIIQANIHDASYQALAQQKGVTLLREAFADRAYLPNGQLAPRSQAGSLYQTASPILAQARRLLAESEAETLCFHSDNPASVLALKQLRQSLPRESAE